MQPSAQERYPGRLAFAVSGGGTGCSPSGSASRFEGKIHIGNVAAAYSSGSKKAKAARQQRGKGKLTKKVGQKMNERVLDSLDGPASGMFGRVTKMLGGKFVRVVLDDDSEITAVMRGLLRSKKLAPMEVGSKVLLSGCPEQGWDVVAVIDDRAAGVIAHMGRMPVWMAANGDRPSEEEVDDVFDRSVELAVDEDGNVKVDGSDLAQLITHKFCTPAPSGGAGSGASALEGNELTEAEIDAI